MSKRPLAALATAALVASFLFTLGSPASADHTNPSDQLAATTGTPAVGNTTGEGTWTFVQNFPANPGSDLELFTKDGVVYSSSGTLGQAPEQSVGQRILKLLDADGTVNVEWVADHGSAHCDATPATVTGTTGLQHDTQVTPDNLQEGEPELIIDTTDANGRCHDTPGGGLEFIDISGLGDEGFEMREIGLTRHDGTSHTVTVDATRPWVVYNNPSDFGGSPWIEVLDIRTCLGLDGMDLEAKRAACRPQSYRIPFEPAWSSPSAVEEPTPATAANCHDITVTPGRVYCAGLAATLIFDVSGLTDAEGNIRGEPLPAEVVPGTDTTAMVTNFQVPGDAATPYERWEAIGSPVAEGWEFLGSFRHAARACPGGVTTCNSNTEVPSDQDIAVAHEADPTPDGNYMFVTDERGGGIVPGGASCQPGMDNPYGNGGVHMFDISDPANPEYVLTPDGDRAVFITDAIIPSATFCTAHVMELIPGEQRFIIAWYSQGTKLVDYEFDENGNVTFTEVAGFQLDGAETWVAEPFKIERDGDQVTYHILANDIARGVDYFTWTGPAGPAAPDSQPTEEPTVPPTDEPTEEPTEEPTGEPGTLTIERESGTSRIETAISVSQEAYQTAETVVLARADVYADALAGAPLAADRGAPILLTDRLVLSDPTAEEIERLEASRAILLGGVDALSPAIEAELTLMGLDVTRVSGENRFGTAAAVMTELDPESGTAAFVAEGEHTDPDRGWPDALSAAPYASFSGRPILLVNRDRYPQETADALDALQPDETIVVGGEAAVSMEVYGEIGTAGHSPRRLFGPNRYATSRAVYDEAVAAGMDDTALWLATGLNWPDALAAGPAVGVLGQSFMLVNGEDLDSSPETRALLEEKRDVITEVHLLGGTAAISAGVEADIRAILTGGDAAGATPTAARRGLPPLSGDALLVLLAAVVLPVAALAGRRRRVLA